MRVIAYAIAAFSYLMMIALMARMLPVELAAGAKYKWGFLIFDGTKLFAKPDQRRRFIWTAIFMFLTALMIVAGREMQLME